MQTRNQSYLYMNVGFLAMSMAAAMAKIIAWDAAAIVVARMLVAALALGLFMWIRRVSFFMPIREILITGGLGVILAFHWITFFYSSQVSSATIALLSVSTAPIFMVFFEPLLSKEKLRIPDILIAFCGFGGVTILLENLTWGDSVTQGVIFGMLAASLMSIRIILSKNHVRQYSGGATMFYQLAIGGLVISPLLFLYPITPTIFDVTNLLILAVIGTALGHTATLMSLHNLSGRTVSIFGNSVPFYGILIAFFLLEEVPSIRAILGGLIIISTAVIETIRHR